MSNSIKLIKVNFVLRKSVDCRSRSKKKRRNDIRLNNPDLLSCGSHFYVDSCSQVIKNRIDWDIKKYLTLMNSM